MFDVDQPKFDINCKMTYNLFWGQGVQNSTDSPETKTEFTVLALSVRENVEALLCNR